MINLFRPVTPDAGRKLITFSLKTMTSITIVEEPDILAQYIAVDTRKRYTKIRGRKMEATQTTDSEDTQEEKVTFESLLADFREIREIQRETTKQMEEANKRLGRYENRYGEMVEHMVKPALVKGFNELGFEVTRAGQNIKIFDAKNNIFTEIDYILEDGDKVIIV